MAAVVVIGVMMAATVIERVVYYIATGPGRIRPALVFGPLWGRKIGTGKGPARIAVARRPPGMGEPSACRIERQSKGKADRAGEIR